MIGSASSKRTKRTPITGAPSPEISPAGEVIANNVDLLTEILLRLPAKSLIRFKSVSKHWFSLISNSQFSITHSRRNPNPSISSWFFSSTPHEHSIQPKINHSCNGLLLIEFVLTSKHYFMVYNPTIQKYALIPEPTVYSDWSNPRMLRAYLDFDPSKSRHYKVILLSSCYYNFNVRIDTYCSGSTSWKQIRAPRNGRELIHAAFSGGVLYWFSDENMLVGFDVDSEKMIEMPKAPKIQRADKIQYFGGCGGRLILILDQTVIKILEMDKNDGSWKIDCEFDLRLIAASLHRATPYWNSNSSVLSLAKKEEGKGYELTVAFPREVYSGKVITYNVSYVMELKKYTVLSPPTWPSKLPRLARLAFDPSESPHYKVVSVSRDPYQIDFYSSHSACWRQVFVQDKCYGHGVFWNGAIHLLSDENALWRFDADVEKLITMPKPPTSGFLDKILYFGEWVGSLILITLVDSESWRWMGTPIVGLSSVGSILRSSISKLLEIEKIDFEFRVLCVVKGEGEKDFTLLVLAIQGRIISYYRKCETRTVLRDLGRYELIDARTVLRSLGRYELIDDDAYPFVETLFAF